MFNNFLSSAQRFVEQQKKKIQPVVQKVSAFVQPALQKIRSSFQQPFKQTPSPQPIQSYPQTFVSSAQRALSNVGGAVKKYTAPILQNISESSQKYFAPTPQVRIRDVVREFPGATGTFIKEGVVQPTMRSIPTLISTLGEKIGTGSVSQSDIQSSFPNQRVRSYLFGDKPIESVQKQVPQISPTISTYLQKTGMSSDEANKISPILTGTGILAGSIFNAIPGDPSDLLRIGGKTIAKSGKAIAKKGIQELGERFAKEGAEKLARESIEKIAKETGEILSEKELKKMTTQEAEKFVQESIRKTPILSEKTVAETLLSPMKEIEKKGIKETPTLFGKRAPTVEGLGIKPVAQNITRKEDVLLRERLRAEVRGAQAGFQEGKTVT
ncbi:MAG: hypothetical protein AAB922_05590, partial [Patescibacteria group bacterium]